MERERVTNEGRAWRQKRDFGEASSSTRATRDGVSSGRLSIQFLVTLTETLFLSGCSCNVTARLRVSGRSRRLHGRGTAAVTHGTRIRALSTLARPQRGERPRVSVSSDSSAVDIQAITFIYKYVSPNCGTSISLPMMRYSSVCVCACVRVSVISVRGDE